ncbi:hypothetical protein JW898_00705 [Candidatus Woesearchaeota archaeon]|nr:hypothetical protein [Candidatus Woesearchaeota archaeon]
MEYMKRKLLLNHLYLNARRRGHRAEPGSPLQVYMLNFHLLSLEIRPVENGFGVKLYTCMFPSGHEICEDDLLFQHLRVVYEGDQDGLDRVLLERFGINDAGAKEPDDYKLLRFRGSKDGRELAKDDENAFDMLLDYCSANCLTSV